MPSLQTIYAVNNFMITQIVSKAIHFLCALASTSKFPAGAPYAHLLEITSYVLILNSIRRITVHQMHIRCDVRKPSQ